jgi:serralysin
LRRIDADLTQDGDQAFHLVNKFTHHAGELLLTYDSARGVSLLQGDVDGNGKADLIIWLTGDQHQFASFVL